MVLAPTNPTLTPWIHPGKTFVLSRIIDELRQRYGGEFGQRVAVCASTGIAATHIGGEVEKQGAYAGRGLWGTDRSAGGAYDGRGLWRAGRLSGV